MQHIEVIRKYIFGRLGLFFLHTLLVLTRRFLWTGVGVRVSGGVGVGFFGGKDDIGTPQEETGVDVCIAPPKARIYYPSSALIG